MIVKPQCMNRSCGHNYVVLTSTANRKNTFCTMTCEQDAINNALQVYVFVVAKDRSEGKLPRTRAAAGGR
jgi:hypothetical protein